MQSKEVKVIYNIETVKFTVLLTFAKIIRRKQNAQTMSTFWINITGKHPRSNSHLVHILIETNCLTIKLFTSQTKISVYQNNFFEIFLALHFSIEHKPWIQTKQWFLRPIWYSVHIIEPGIIEKHIHPFSLTISALK